MALHWILLIDAAVLYLLFGRSLRRMLTPQRRKLRATLGEYRRHLRHLQRRDGDLLSDDQHRQVEHLLESSQTERNEDQEPIKQKIMELDKALPSLAPVRRPAWTREYLEVLVVAVGIAFGIRALFLQPFKIPTGSMQPTLYGIHAAPMDRAEPPSPPRQAFDFLHYSKRYAHAVVERSGRLEGVYPARPAIPLWPSVEVRIAGVEYRLPGKADHRQPGAVHTYLNMPASSRDRLPYYEEGEPLAHAVLKLGDHLFVNRWHYSFQEPRRGDITVFTTTGIRDQKGNSLTGRYYIKRLVGLPGEDLKIVNDRLHVREKGAAEFRPVSGDDHPAFERIYAKKNGYEGHTHTAHGRTGSFLTDDDDVFHVPENHYFMLGDNTDNSRDSRFWGAVPRENLVGPAAFAWWPFSERWGPIGSRNGVAKKNRE